MMKKTLIIALSLIVCFGSVTGGVFAEQNDKKPATEVKQEKEKPNQLDKELKDTDKSQENKSKIVKETLEEKKKERAEARLEAKDYIQDLKELFQGADNETKKEILDEIAEVKKELKDDSIGIFVRGLNVNFDKYNGVKPIVKHERTLVPIRALMDAMQADINWDGAKQEVTITKDGILIVMTLGSETAYVNGKKVELEVAPEAEHNRILVPARFIAEVFDLNVTWDQKSHTIVIE